jgi:hypothetical protein
LNSSESKLSARLERIAGQDEMTRFRQEIYANFITEGDIRRIAAFGLNVVRVPMNNSIFDGDAGWEVLDHLLSWGEKYHVYVVLDLHSAPGGQSRVFTSDPKGGALLWNSAENQARTIALWKAIAGRYRDRSIVAGYDLLNEPDPPNGEQLAALYRKIVAAIREVDPSHMIFVEGGKFASDFSMFSEPLSANQAYSFHMYTLLQDNRKQRLDEYKRLSKTQNVPLWCGEFGVSSYDTIDGTLGLFDQDDAVAGWAFWTWKRSPGKDPYLMGIKLPPQWSHLIERASSPLGLGEPSKTEALEAMKEFVAAVRVENNVDDAKMGSILTSHAKR